MSKKAKENSDQEVKKLIDKHVSDYCLLLSQKYKLDNEDLFKEWKKMKITEDTDIPSELKSPPKSVKKTLEVSEKSKEITIERISNPSTTKDMLSAMCEAKGLKKSGKKKN